jgi:hypothetical protein
VWPACGLSLWEYLGRLRPPFLLTLAEQSALNIAAVHTRLSPGQTSCWLGLFIVPGPLIQHARPLPDGQSDTWAVLGHAVEDTAGLVQAAAGEQRRKQEPNILLCVNALLVPLYVSEYGTTGGLQMIWVIVALIPIGLLMAVGVVILVCLTAITRSRRRNGITQPLMWWGYPTAQRPSWTAIRGASEGQPRSLRPTTRHL